MEERTKELYMYILGAVVIIGFFSVVVYKLYKNFDVQLEVGALIGFAGAVVGYFYGSSKGSNDKNKVIEDQQKKING